MLTWPVAAVAQVGAKQIQSITSAQAAEIPNPIEARESITESVREHWLTHRTKLRDFANCPGVKGKIVVDTQSSDVINDQISDSFGLTLDPKEKQPFRDTDIIIISNNL